MKKLTLIILFATLLVIPCHALASTVSVLVVGGGGQGGGNPGFGYQGYGGGGAGGLIYNSSYAVTPQTYTVTVGAGGSGAETATGNNGADSIFSTLDAVGGGGGSVGNGSNGGSGGGGGDQNPGSGGSGTAGQGSAGGTGTINAYAAGAGGGGAGAAAIDAFNGFGGIPSQGGKGIAETISGSSVTYAGGGGGGANSSAYSHAGGGAGGGGDGGYGSNGIDGAPNTGGGGGGAGDDNTTNYNPGAGGSGIVIIAASTGSISATCSGCTITASGGNTIWTFDSSGTWTLGAPGALAAPKGSVVLESPPVSGLAAYWTFNGNTISWSTDQETDSSGNGNTGQLYDFSTSTSLIIGKVGQALIFNGSNTYMNLASNPISSVSSPSSVCTWAKTANINSNPGGFDQAFLNFAANSNNALRMGAVVTTGQLYAAYRIGGTYYRAQSASGVFANGAWVHVCSVWDGTNFTMYANGASVATTTSGEVTNSVSLVGALDGFGDGSWDGPLDDMRVYSRALTAAEVLDIYHSALATVGQSQSPDNLATGLVGWWTMDGKNMVNNVADSSGDGNNGYLVGFTSTSSAVVQGKIGQALSFSGLSTQYVLTSSSTSLWLNGNKTFSFWIKPASNSFGQVLGYGNWCTSPYSGFDISRGANGAYVQYSYGANGANFTLALTGSTPINKWTFVTLVHNESSTMITLYINSASSSSAVTVPNSYAVGKIFSIGKVDLSCGKTGASQALDDVRVYSRALSAAEVKQLYLNGAATIDTSQSPDNLSTGLAGYWPFDGKDMNWTKDTTADISGNGDTGQLYNMSTSTSPVIGKLGQALFFNGTNQYIDLGTGNPVGSASDFTLSAWVDVAGFASNNSMIIAKGNDATANFYALTVDASNPAFEIYPSSGSLQTLGSGTALPENTWVFLTGTLAGSTMTLYVDGAVAGSATLTGSFSTNSASLRLGDQNRSGTGGACGGLCSYPFDGSIDDVRIYSRALSAAEVEQLYLIGG